MSTLGSFSLLASEKRKNTYEITIESNGFFSPKFDFDIIKKQTIQSTNTNDKIREVCLKNPENQMDQKDKFSTRKMAKLIFSRLVLNEIKTGIRRCLRKNKITDKHSFPLGGFNIFLAALRHLMPDLHSQLEKKLGIMYLTVQQKNGLEYKLATVLSRKIRGFIMSSAFEVPSKKTLEDVVSHFYAIAHVLLLSESNFEHIIDFWKIQLKQALQENILQLK